MAARPLPDIEATRKRFACDPETGGIMREARNQAERKFGFYANRGLNPNVRD